ncbi:MAG: transporter substrate-binding domain-containing protein [Ancalomicrobiaceae bacterium]|nr:transporter substrate-binding domain-containing protein [Ancalomicrobiaceae bacterium]
MRSVVRSLALLLGLCLLLGAAILPAQAQSLAELKARGTVKVGMLVDFPPFGIMNNDNKPDGYDADVAKALAENLGLKLDLVPVTGPNRIPYLLSGQIDVLVASLGITPERAEKVTFSKPYAGIRVAVIGMVGTDMSTPDKLIGKRVGVARASTQDISFTKVAKPGTLIQRFDDDASAVQALLSGQVDAIGCSNVVIDQILKVAPGRFEEKFPLSQQVQGIAVRPGSTEFLGAVDKFLVELKTSGRLNDISKKWLGAPAAEFVLKSN